MGAVESVGSEHVASEPSYRDITERTELRDGIHVTARIGWYRNHEVPYKLYASKELIGGTFPKIVAEGQFKDEETARLVMDGLFERDFEDTEVSDTLLGRSGNFRISYDVWPLADYDAANFGVRVIPANPFYVEGATIVADTLVWRSDSEAARLESIVIGIAKFMDSMYDES